MEKEEGRKKRWRPSLTAYREQEETIHLQCLELDAWREKYHALKASYDHVDGERRKLSEVVSRQKKQMEANEVVTVGEYSGLLAEVRRLEEDLSVEKARSELLDSIVSQKEERIAELESRGFWSRVFNRK